MSITPVEQFMRQAIEETRRGIAAGQTPFGACIVRGDLVIAVGHNQVWRDTDITAHGEIVTLRKACKQIQGIDLTGCVIYSTTEPCPMCFSACHWARLDAIIFGAAIADAQTAGFNELTVSDQDLKRLGGSPIQIVPGFMRNECAALFSEWLAHPAKRSY